jgi:hypothetical protein
MQLEVALRRYLNTNCFYFADEFIVLKNYL